MAIEAQLEDEQQQEQGIQQPTQMGQEAPQDQEGAEMLGGQQSTQIGQQAQVATQTQPVQSTEGRKGSGMGARLSNLRKYIEANRGAGMAQQIKSDIQQTGQQLGEQIGVARSGFEQAKQKEQQRLERGQQLVKGQEEGGLGVLEQGRTAQFAGTATQQELPQEFQQFGETAEQRMGEFGKYRAGEFEAPEIQQMQQLQQEQKKLAERAEMTGTEKGRYQLLREVFQRPGYTTGQQRLDQLLLQAAPSEVAELAKIRETAAQPTAQELEQLGLAQTTAREALGTQAGALQQDIARRLYGEAGAPVVDPQTGQLTDVGTGVLSQFGTGLEEAQRTAATDIGQRFSQLQQKIQRGEPITQEEMTLLGRADEPMTKEFLDYYQRGVQPTLGEQVAAGKTLTDDNLAAIAPVIGMDVETMKGIQSKQPLTMEEFANSPSNVDLLGPNVDPRAMAMRYQQYLGDIEKSKQGLSDLMKQAVEEVPELAGYRKAQPIDFGQYLSTLGEGDIQLERVASAEDFARQAALQGLSDTGFSPLQAGQAELAGTIGDVGVGRFGLEGALSEAREFYNLPEAEKLARVQAATGSYAPTIGEKIQAGSEQLGGLLGEPGRAYTGTLTGSTTDTISGAERELESLLAGDVGGVAKEELSRSVVPTFAVSDAALAPLAATEKLLTGGEAISKTYDKVKNVTKKIVSGGTFWCTEMANRGLLTQKELDDLHKVMYTMVIPRVGFFDWYIDNGPKLIEIANQHGYDWNIAKEIVDDVIELSRKGKYLQAADTYADLVINMCQFTQVEIPMDCASFKLKHLLKLPKVLKFYIKFKLGIK